MVISLETNVLLSEISNQSRGWHILASANRRQNALAIRIEVKRNRGGCRSFGGHKFPLLDGCNCGLRENWISSKHFGAFHGSFRGDRNFQSNRAPNLSHPQHGWIVRLNPRDKFPFAFGILLSRRQRCNGKVQIEKQIISHKLDSSCSPPPCLEYDYPSCQVEPDIVISHSWMRPSR